MKIANILTVALAVSAISIVTTSCNMEEHKEKREERREERKEHREERHDERKEKEAEKAAEKVQEAKKANSTTQAAPK